MLKTKKHAIKRAVVQNGGGWAEAVPNVLYVYRVRDRRDFILPFRLRYGIEPRMIVSDAVAIPSEGNPAIGNISFSSKGQEGGEKVKA